MAMDCLCPLNIDECGEGKAIFTVILLSVVRGVAACSPSQARPVTTVDRVCQVSASL